jgi:hypothetical protein
VPGCFPAALDGTPAFKSLDVRAVWTSRLRELVADYAQWNLHVRGVGAAFLAMPS